MRKGSTIIRLAGMVLAVVFLCSYVVGCASMPAKLEIVAINGSARTVGCLAAKEVKSPDDLKDIVALTKMVAKGDTSEIEILISEIELLEDDNLSKIIALSLCDILEIYGLPVPSAVLPIPPEVKMAAEAFLQGVKICEE